jgi:uncharacterized membrane protein
MAILAVAVCVFLVATPILAILALTRVREVSEKLEEARLQDLVARVYSLEQRIATVAEGLTAQVAGQASPLAAPVAPLAPETPETFLPPIVIPGVPVTPVKPVQEPAKPQEPASTIPPKPRETHPSIPQPKPPSQPAPQARPSPPAQPPISPLPPLTIAHAKTSSSPDLEDLIAGNWFNRIGISALILSVSFFLKYAFDNNWVGPAGRVAIGLVLGAAMLPWSQWLLGRGYSYFSEGIAALGQATLLLSIWAGCHYYSLFSLDVGFVGMVVVTAVMALIAVGRKSERVALLSLIGGFVTPLLLSSGKDAQVVLFSYLLVLGGGLLVIGALRDWRSIAPVSFVFTQLYFWGWYNTFYKPAKLELTLLFATLFFLLYFALPVIRTIRKSSLDRVGMFVVFVNSFAYLGALYVLLWPEYRWTLTALVLVLAAMHIGVARFVRSAKPGEWPVTQQLFAGLALTFITVAIPIRLDGKWITLALAVEGAILVRTGFRALAPMLRYAGFLLVAVAALRVVFISLPAQPFLLNERFGTYLGVIVCMGVALWASRESGAASPSESEKVVLGIFAVAIHAYALLALSLELWDYFGRASSLGIDRGLAQHLALSVLWTVYATVLLLTGIKRQSALLRWQGLVLFGLVVVKVFLYDSSYLERFYRILSFFILGIVLVIISFLYQSKASRERASS